MCPTEYYTRKHKLFGQHLLVFPSHEQVETRIYLALTVNI